MNPNTPQEQSDNPSPEPFTPPSTSIAHEPQITAQPPATPPNPPLPPATPQIATSDPGKVLAIVGLVLAFVGLSLIGLILAIIAVVKSSKAGVKNVLGIVAIVINSILLVVTPIFLLITLTAYSGVQSAAKDAVTYAEIKELNEGMVNYIEEKRTIPASLSALVDADENLLESHLTDEDGKAYTLTWEPAGCTSLVSCTAYKISGDSQRHDNEKISIGYDSRTGEATYENQPGSSASN